MTPHHNSHNSHRRHATPRRPPARLFAPPHVSAPPLDYTAPLPPDGFAITTDRFTSDMVTEDPLRRVRVTINGTGESHTDPAAALRGEAGEQGPLPMGPTWGGAGTPYMDPPTPPHEHT